MNCRDYDRNMFIKMPQSWEGEGKRDFSALCTVATPSIVSGAGMTSLCSRVLGWGSCQQACPLSGQERGGLKLEAQRRWSWFKRSNCLLLGLWSLRQDHNPRRGSPTPTVPNPSFLLPIWSQESWVSSSPLYQLCFLSVKRNNIGFTGNSNALLLIGLGSDRCHHQCQELHQIRQEWWRCSWWWLTA